MAAPVCTVANFATAIACYKNFNAEERKSILIYFNAVELAAIGGTNYVAQLGPTGQLQADSVCYKNLFLQSPDPDLEYLVIAYNNAVNAGGSPASTPDTIATAISCNKNFSPNDKAAQLLNLTCQLGCHKAYPQ